MQYLFQGWGYRGPDKYRDMILSTATEEIGHIELLATAVSMNLEGAKFEPARRSGRWASCTLHRRMGARTASSARLGAFGLLARLSPSATWPPA